MGRKYENNKGRGEYIFIYRIFVDEYQEFKPQ
jgi:hypothetical protein